MCRAGLWRHSLARPEGEEVKPFPDAFNAPPMGLSACFSRNEGPEVQADAAAKWVGRGRRCVQQRQWTLAQATVRGCEGCGWWQPLSLAFASEAANYPECLGGIFRAGSCFPSCSFQGSRICGAEQAKSPGGLASAT